MAEQEVRTYGTINHYSDEYVEEPVGRRRIFTCQYVLILVVVVLAVITSFLAALYIWIQPQLTCLGHNDPPRPQSTWSDFQNHSFAVGFDLTAGYGTAVVLLPDGTFVDVARVDGSETYNDVLARLSLESSAHATPPYYNCNKQKADLSRQWRRYYNKLAGRPASDEVKALSEVLVQLRDQTNQFLEQFNASMDVAFVTAPLLPALYLEDLNDAAEHANIQMLTLPNAMYRSGDQGQWPVSEFNTAFAGNGYGIGHLYSAQSKEANDVPWSNNVFNVLFTNTTLSAHVGPIESASHFYWANGIANFSLGLSHEAEPHYWYQVRINLNRALNSYLHRGHKLGRVIVHGEHAEHEKFGQTLREEVLRVQESKDPAKMPQFSSKDPVFAAARGAALFAHSCPRMPHFLSCFPDLTSKMQGW